mmetsp:Transcript_16641/g.35965  ORF Transcript_16641/g.35965 Transcript_16641/m.35965 type:complete len:245 (-) Transcript_16641:5-739(-)
MVLKLATSCSFVIGTMGVFDPLLLLLFFRSSCDSSSFRDDLEWDRRPCLLLDRSLSRPRDSLRRRCSLSPRLPLRDDRFSSEVCENCTASFAPSSDPAAASSSDISMASSALLSSSPSVAAAAASSSPSAPLSKKYSEICVLSKIFTVSSTLALSQALRYCNTLGFNNCKYIEANVYDTSLVPPLPSLNVNVWGVVASYGADPRMMRFFPSSDREVLVERLPVQALRRRSMGEEVAMVTVVCDY